MAFNIVWFLDIQCIYMSLIAAGLASGIHLIAALVAAIRIGRWQAFLFILILPIYTFFSCVFYTVILAITVMFTYQYTGNILDAVIVYWGLGFGALYVLLKMVSAKYIK
jgi:hypothetical protein